MKGTDIQVSIYRQIISLSTKAIRHSYLTLILKFHIKIVRKLQCIDFTTMNVQKQFSIFHSFILIHIFPQITQESFLYCVLGTFRVEMQSSHTLSQFRREEVTGLFKVHFCSTACIFKKSSLNHICFSCACPQCPTEIEFGPITTTSI